MVFGLMGLLPSSGPPVGSDPLMAPAARSGKDQIMEEEGREATGFETAILSVSLVSIWIDGLKRLLVKLSQSIMLPLNIQSFNYQL